MKCKYCGEEMAQWGGFCPVCGKNNSEEPREPLPETEEMEEAVLWDEGQQTPFTEPEEAPQEADEASAKTKKMKRNMAMVGCVALLAVLATVLFFGIRGGWDVGGWFDWLKPRENTIAYKDSYTLEDKKVIKKMEDVVATMDGLELTNAQLQIYYWSEVYNFLNSYYSYLSYIGFDYTAPLDQQTCYFDKTMTWQQYFLKSALDVWQSNMAFAELARENNFVMPEEQRTELDSMVENLTKSAQEGGYDSVDAMVQESFGAGVTVQDYVEYMEDYYLGYLYFAELYEAIDPTDEEIAAYFEANKATFEKDGIKQDGTYTVDVRHILIKIDTIAAEMEKNETTEDGTDAQDDEESTDDKTDSKYTEAQWEACRQAAQAILDEYLAGERTEERFGELANKYSEDHGNEEGAQVTDGGIYTFVEKGYMVEAFDAWCFDTARQVGDTGLVKTEFGYHVMYFVGSEEVWFTQTRSAYISDKSNEIVADALEGYTVEVNYKKIVLGNVAL